MAEQEAKKIEVEAECPPPAVEPVVELPKEEAPHAAPAAEEEKAVPCAEEEKAIVPVEAPPPPPVDEEKPVDDSKALAIVEKPAEEKPAEEGSINRDAVLARVATEKKDALIKAWEESEKSKAENKAQQKLSAITAWENSKKADIEADIKKMEEQLEKQKAKYVEKMKNKIALLHKTAEERRAFAEAKKGEELLKAEEVAAKCRATGSTPKKLLGWFSS